VQLGRDRLIHLGRLRYVIDTRQIRGDQFIFYHVSRENQISAGAPRSREYGRAGLFGLLTPQGNPTAEPELRILLPAGSAMLAARLTSSSPELRQRLLDYGERLGGFVDEFGDIAFDAVGFACTGASYGIDSADERQRTHAIAARKGYPIVTAAQAIEAALATLGVGTIALVSPYPAWLTDACLAYWGRHGVRVTATLQLLSGPGESHRIYTLSSSAVLEAIASFDALGAEAVLLAGTGMPSLRAILALEATQEVPVLSSNLCLAWALARSTGDARPGPESRLYGGWAARLAAA
jgi:maleate isomerase